MALYHTDMCACLLPQRFQLPEVPDTQIHFIIQTVILQIPDHDMMGFTEIQEAFRRITAQPDPHISLQITKEGNQQYFTSWISPVIFISSLA